MKFFVSVLFAAIIGNCLSQVPTLDWAASIGVGTAGPAYGNITKKDASDNIFVCGSFDGMLDVDPSSSVYNIKSYPGSVDFFIAKYSASGNFLWAKSIGGPQVDKCTGIDIDNIGNVLMTGNFQGSVDFDPGPATFMLTSPGISMFIVKLDQSGNFVWAKSMGNQFGSSSNALAVDKSNNVIVTGNFSGTVDFDPGPSVASYTALSGSDLFIAKYNQSGNLVWIQVVQNTGSAASGLVLATDNLKNIFIGGKYLGPLDFDTSPATATLTATSYDFFIEKLDSSGNFQFVKDIKGPANDVLNSIALDNDKNILISGNILNTVDFDPSVSTVNLNPGPNGQDAFVAKYDSLGTYAWAFNFGSSGAHDCKSVVTDSSGDVYITGVFNAVCDFDPSAATANLSSTGSSDIYIAKYTSAGAYLFAKKMGAAQAEEGTSLAILNNGQVVNTGWFGDVGDFDPSVATYTIAPSAWNPASKIGFYVSSYSQASCTFSFAFSSRDYWSTFDVPSMIKKDASGNLYVCGYFNGAVDFDLSPTSEYYLSSQGSSDGFVAKYSSSGTFIWARRIGGPGIDECKGIALDNLGNCYVTGQFQGTATFNPGLTATLTAVGLVDAYLMKLNSSGFLLWHQGMGSTSNESGISVAVSGSDVILTGYFDGTLDLDPSSNSTLVNTFGDRDIFFSRYDQFGGFLWGYGIGSSMQDNPSSITVDNNGDIVLAGTFANVMDFDPGPSIESESCSGLTDIFIAKYTSNGLCYWANKIGNTGSDIPRCLYIDPQTNDYLICGNFTGTVDFNPASLATNNLTANNGGAFAAKYDFNGLYIWATSHSLSANSYASGITTDAASNIYVTGCIFGSGTFLGQNITTASGDNFIVKYNSAGVSQWYTITGGGGIDAGVSIVVDSNNEIYQTGTFSGVADFDPSAGVSNLYGAGNDDIFICKYKLCSDYTVAVSSQTNVSCNGGNNAAISLNTSAGPGATYSWTPGTATTSIVTGLTAGTYSCLVYSSCGLAKSTTATVTQPIPLTGSISPISSLCVGSTATVQAFVTGGTAPYTYTWSNGSTAINQTITLTAPISLTFTTTDMNGCIKTVTNTINPAPIPTINISATAYTACAGAGVTLMASGANTYTWSTGLTGANMFVTLQSSITYTVNGKNNAGCIDSETISLTVNPNPSLVVQTSPAVLCAGDAATLTVSGAQSYTWNGSVASGSLYAPTVQGTYTVSGVDGFGCSNSILYTPTVNPLPSINVVSSTSILCAGNTATLNASGASSYTWNTGSTSSNIVISPTTSTSYTVEASSIAGCTNTAMYTQSVSVCTDVDSRLVENELFNIYPNPNNGHFNVQICNYSEITALQIQTITGQIIFDQPVSETVSHINLESFANGIYIVRVLKDDGGVVSTKIVKY